VVNGNLSVRRRTLGRERPRRRFCAAGGQAGIGPGTLGACSRTRCLGPGGRLTTSVSGGAAPSASIPEATDLVRRVGEKIDGLPQGLVTELLLGTPTTAHILGGACMGATPDEGVIDSHHRVFGHEGLYVIDGAAISANPGVNPSLTIAALAERAMSFVPAGDGALPPAS